MNDYISREDALKIAWDEYDAGTPWDIPYRLERLPAADVIERNTLQHAQHVESVKNALDVPERNVGKWLPIIDADEYGEPYQSGVYCSECGEMLWYVPHFCPNCGAKMEGNE